MKVELLQHLDPTMLRAREDHAATQGFLGGLALGILLGVVLALVFTPRRGDEVRAAVAETALDVKDKASHLITRGGADGDAHDFGDGAAIEREIGAPVTST